MASSWFWNWGIVVLFYVAVILVIYFNRRKFTFEGKFIAMYKTKIGLKLMDKIGYKHPKTIKVLSFIGIIIGYLGMLGMVALIVYGIFLLVFRPEAPAIFSPVLPGVQIPGSPIKLPLIEGLISLFIVIVVHEFSHGVVARAYNMRVKSSGLVMIGPIPGAFVEPDEKQLNKSQAKAQLSVFSAGPFSNVLLAIAVLLISIGLGVGFDSMYSPTGVMIDGHVDIGDSQAGGRLSQFGSGEVVLEINGKSVRELRDIRDALSTQKPGDIISIRTDEGMKQLELTSDPKNGTLPYMGLMFNSLPVYESKTGASILMDALKYIILWVLGLLFWLWNISLGIGIVNLLPLGPVDGGRMYLTALRSFLDEKKSKLIWSKTATILLLLMVLLVFVPIIRAII